MYNLLDHGDLLEKEAAEFIRGKFPHYETVWQTYIGNTGNATKAPLPGYPDEDKRSTFAEHSYTTLESCYMMKLLLDSNIFITEIKSFAAYIDFNRSFFCFFAYLGRMCDTALKAATDLRLNTDDFYEDLRPFYDARNIVMHGKKVPVILDNLGLVQMPILKTRSLTGEGWHDKEGWDKIKHMPKTYVYDDCAGYFQDIVERVNNEYARFNDIIQQELKAIPTSLQFVRNNVGLYSHSPSVRLEASGSTEVSNGAVDAYHIKEGYSGWKNP